MKRFLLTLSAVVALSAGTIGAANALGVGPNGVYVSPYRHYYNYYDRDNCRTVITLTNRFGDEVTVRRRVCD